MTIYGSMFNVTDVENAADDPFGLGEGRHRIVISESGPDTIKFDDQESAVWKVVLRDPDDDPESFRKQDVLYFLEGDAQQMSRTNTNIKRMLRGLEIPATDWEKISANPEKLVGKFGIVEIAKSKKDRLFVKEWFADSGAPVGKDSSATAAGFQNAASKVYDL